MGTEMEETTVAVKHDTDFSKGVFGTSDNWLFLIRII